MAQYNCHAQEFGSRNVCPRGHVRSKIYRPVSPVCCDTSAAIIASWFITRVHYSCYYYLLA
eukprot:9724215-Heterocapsa_arctica.AAC.1